MINLSIETIQQAAKYLNGLIVRTPVEFSPELSKILGVDIYLKMEFLQTTGSFKLRGALWRLENLSSEEREKGVVTCSAGNHGKALAYAAHKMGIKATVFVPRDVDQVKFDGIRYYGAEVIKAEKPGYDSAKELAYEFAAKTGRPYISSYDDDPIMVGNGGTLAMETMEQVPDAKNFILPVGGGGLSAGFSFYAKDKQPESIIIGCQLAESPALKLSLEKGEAVTKLPATHTVAGGIEGGLGANCFKYLKTRVDQVVLAEEEEIVKGFQWMLANHQYLIEPTSAVTIAACLGGKMKKLDGPAVVVVCGRNVSYSTIKELIANPDQYLELRNKR